MHEEKAITVLVDGLHRISPALEVVGDVEFKLHITRVAGLQDTINFFWALPNRFHVIVIAELHAKIGRALSDLGNSTAQSFVIGGSNSSLGFLIDDLEV